MPDCARGSQQMTHSSWQPGFRACDDPAEEWSHRQLEFPGRLRGATERIGVLHDEGSHCAPHERPSGDKSAKLFALRESELATFTNRKSPGSSEGETAEAFV